MASPLPWGAGAAGTAVSPLSHTAVSPLSRRAGALLPCAEVLQETHRLLFSPREQPWGCWWVWSGAVPGTCSGSVAGWEQDGARRGGTVLQEPLPTPGRSRTGNSLSSIFLGLSWVPKCISWKSGDVREQGGQPACHQEQHRAHREVPISRNAFRIHFLSGHPWVLTIAEEASVLAGAERGFPPAEASSARGSTAPLLALRKSSTTWMQMPGWEDGFAVALLYNKHFKTCLLLLRVLACRTLPKMQPGMKIDSQDWDALFSSGK